MSSIRVVYNSQTGLVQKVGRAGVFLGNSPITYSHSIEGVNSITSNYSIATESFIIVDAASNDVNITLPNPEAGRLVSIKKIDASSNIVTVLPNASETIDGGESAIITTQWTSVTLQAIGSNWYIR